MQKGILMQEQDSIHAVVALTDDDFIKSRIFTVRGIQVVLDRDLAELYGVQTKVLNQAVKRNASRFPSEFMFVLAKDEMEELVTNCDRNCPDAVWTNVDSAGFAVEIAALWSMRFRGR